MESEIYFESYKEFKKLADRSFEIYEKLAREGGSSEKQLVERLTELGKYIAYTDCATMFLLKYKEAKDKEQGGNECQAQKAVASKLEKPTAKNTVTISTSE